MVPEAWRGPFLAGPLIGAVGVALATVGVGVGAGTLGAPAAPLLAEAVERAGMPGSSGLSASIMTLVFAAGYVVGPLAGAAASAIAPVAVITLVAAPGVVLTAVRAARLAARG